MNDLLLYLAGLSLGYALRACRKKPAVPVDEPQPTSPPANPRTPAMGYALREAWLRLAPHSMSPFHKSLLRQYHVLGGLTKRQWSRAEEWVEERYAEEWVKEWVEGQEWRGSDEK